MLASNLGRPAIRSLGNFRGVGDAMLFQDQSGWVIEEAPEDTPNILTVKNHSSLLSAGAMKWLKYVC